MSAEQNSVTPPPEKVKFLVKIVRHNRAVKVHLAAVKAGSPSIGPRCGGGNGGKSVIGWQEDIGPCNCGRCTQLVNRKERREHKNEINHAHSNV